MVDKLVVNPLLFVAVSDKVDESNPEAAKKGLAHIWISVAEGFAPEILSTVPPEAVDEIIDWLVANRKERSMEMGLIFEGPSDSDTVQ